MRWVVLVFSIGILFFGYKGGYSQTCVPNCDGKECGDDGCGGSCGTCQAPAQCVVDKCVKGCGSVPSIIGCCYKGFAIDCNMYVPGKPSWRIAKCKTGETCAWDSDLDLYFCVKSPEHMEDPTGRFSRECDFTCVPDCSNGKDCGPDGCGGTCGDCGDDGICMDGYCCQRGCKGRECGPDNCGGVCGECENQEECVEGRCVPKYGCMATDMPGCPDCACEQCVCKKDPYCCRRKWDKECVRLCKEECGGCKKCVPDCKGKECGPDGCGGYCGYCEKGEKCENGKCEKCVPDCTGKECGDDGCGGSCGFCGSYRVCENGKCRDCHPGCLGGENCGFDECGNPCNNNPFNPLTPDCPPPKICLHNRCVECKPYCKDRECGDDGCGYICGTCKDGEECISHHCRPKHSPGTGDNDVEPVPDISEDVHISRDIIEVHDVKEHDTVKPSDTHNNKTKDHGMNKDAGNKPNPARPPSGGCTAATSPASGVYLVLMLLFGLLVLFRRKYRKP